MSVCEGNGVEKIFTIRDVERQRDHMWHARRIEEEVAACSRRRLTRYLLEHLPKDAPILEAGCGLGAWVVFLSERGYNIEGIDHDEKVIARLKEWRPSLKVSCGDVRQLPHADGSLEAVMSLGVVEHFEEGCDSAMREARRVLRPGGLLILTVPLNNLFRRIFAHPIRTSYLKMRQRKGDAIHFAEYRYASAEAEELLRRHGFDPFVTTWDDFLPRGMSLGLWTDFPPLQSGKVFEMTFPGRAAAALLNSASRWIASAGVLCIARKADP